jgi:hypothetical protein
MPVDVNAIGARREQHRRFLDEFEHAACKGAAASAQLFQ